MIKILDCTLRDGGYNNDWKFGERFINLVTSNLTRSKVDIIELGYLSSKEDHFEGRTIFNVRSQYINYINKSLEQDYALMINHGEADTTTIKSQIDKSIIIRYAFHTDDYINALESCKNLISEGYRIFLQPMVTINYSKNEFINLIIWSNENNPEALYIVDSFGSLTLSKLNDLLSTILEFASPNIQLGLHSHDNKGLSLTLASKFIEFTNSNKINGVIDSSILGMGRGAGNLRTEQLIDLIEQEFKSKYFLSPIYAVIDEYFINNVRKITWGHSLIMLISANYNVHPNYAIFLDDLGLLDHNDLDEIISKIPSDKKARFDKNYISTLYKAYITKRAVENDVILKINDRKVFLIAPGNSFISNQVIEKNNDDLVMSVNFIPEKIDVDYAFFSKAKRLNTNSVTSNIVITANIDSRELRHHLEANDLGLTIVDIGKLMNEIAGVEDNAGLMAIKLLVKSNVKEIVLVGFDGYSERENYLSESTYSVGHSLNRIKELNEGISKGILLFSELINISKQ
jgi:4-hydroxy 2-oxovalerate aldolase